MDRDQIEQLKHNTKLDVRLPDQLKDEFLARCREQEQSSGAVLRSLMSDYLTRQRRLSTMTAGLKERVMKRAKWIAGLATGSLTAGLAATGLVFAPAASADDVVLNYFIQLTNFDGVGHSIWYGDFDTRLDGPVTVLPLQRYEDDPHSIEVLARPCDGQEAIKCDVALEIVLYSYDLIDEGQEGQIATRVMTTRFGNGTTFSIDLADGRTLSGHSVPTVAHDPS